jgi:hypothetical protein
MDNEVIDTSKNKERNNEEYREIKINKSTDRIIKSLSKYKRNEISDKEFPNKLIENALNFVKIIDREPIYVFHLQINKILYQLRIIQSLHIEKVKSPIKIQLTQYHRINDINNEIENHDWSIYDKEKYLNAKENQDNERFKAYFHLDMYKYLFIFLVTNIEVYLEDRLKKSLEKNDALFQNFVGKVNNDLPTTWRKGGKIRTCDYYFKMKEIIFDNFLIFPYHEIDGRVNHMYRAAFDLDFMTYPKKQLLMKYLNIRHTIIHKGVSPYIEMGIKIEKKDLIEFIKVAYEFVCWVEENLEKTVK